MLFSLASPLSVSMCKLSAPRLIKALSSRGQTVRLRLGNLHLKQHPPPRRHTHNLHPNTALFMARSSSPTDIITGHYFHHYIAFHHHHDEGRLFPHGEIKHGEDSYLHIRLYISSYYSHILRRLRCSQASAKLKAGCIMGKGLQMEWTFRVSLFLFISFFLFHERASPNHEALMDHHDSQVRSSCFALSWSAKLATDDQPKCLPHLHRVAHSPAVTLLQMKLSKQC